MSFTIQNVVNGMIVLFLMGLMIVGPNMLFNNCDPKTVNDVKICNSLVTNAAIIGWIMGVLGMILTVFAPFFLSLKPKDIRDQLVDEGGPTHGTLPKGYEIQKKPGVNN